MDGDEEQRSTAVAVCDGATGDGAEESGDAAPATTEADSPAPAGSASAVPADPADVEDDGPAALDVADDEAADEPEAPDAAGTADAAAVLVGAEPVRSAPRRIGPCLRRGVLALVAVGMVALAVSAFAWVVPSLEAANERFVEEAQSRGHVIASGEQQMLVLSAARKICDRKIAHSTIAERRSTALTSPELAAVAAVFGAETREFTRLALDAYCSG